MRFSVIICTRDRPELFLGAADSVLSQTSGDFELVVVNDGSAEAHVAAYREAEMLCRDRIGERAVFVSLPRRAKGHGPAYPRNTGCAAASGEYLCFLDDDDCWIDDDYLRTVGNNVARAKAPIDLHFAKQHAYVNDVKMERKTWLEGVEDVLLRRHGTLDPRRSYPVELTDLLATGSHAHLNTMAIHRDLFAVLSGFDESLRYEVDKDLYLRAIDRARGMRYMPAVVARHNVPDPSKSANVSTIVSRLDKLVYQNRTIDKLILFGARPEVRAHAVRLKRFALKHIAEELYRQGRFREAGFYARQALPIGFNVKWLAFTVWMGLRSLVARRDHGARTDASQAPGESLRAIKDDTGRNQPSR